MPSRELTDEELGFLDLVEDESKQRQQKEAEEAGRPGKVRSVISSFAKGAGKQLRKEQDVASQIVADMIGVFGFKSPIFGQEEGEERPKSKRGMLSAEEFGQKIDEQLPSNPGFIEDVAERSGEILLPLLASGGASSLGAAGSAFARSLLIGTAGQTVEELGGGEFAQGAAEVVAGGLPGLAKNVARVGGVFGSSAAAAENAMVSGARRLGLTEEQIAPLIPGATKRAGFGKIARKTGKTQRVLRNTQEGLSNSFDNLKPQLTIIKTTNTISGYLF